MHTLSLSVCLSLSLVDVREIREVRESTESTGRGQEELKVVDSQCCFVIFYGSDFRLKTLSVAGKAVFCLPPLCFLLSFNFTLSLCLSPLAMCREERDAWLDGLRHIMNPNNFQSPHLTNR